VQSLKRNQPPGRGSHIGSWVASVAALVLALVVSLSACGYPATPTAPISSAAYVGVCVDPVTHLRVADGYCGGADPYSGAALDSAGYLWDYYAPTYTGVIPGYRQPVVGVTIIHTVPATTATHVIVIDHGASAAGGSVTAVRAAAAASHSQTTERQRAGAAAPKPGSPKAGRPVPRTGAPAPAGPTRNSSIQRGGFGVSPRAR